jgi:predicted AAA+ superfamily ATPase
VNLIQRTIQSAIEDVLFKGRIVVVYGARQVGKTTLVHMLQEKFPSESIYLNCDEPDIRESLTDKTSTELRRLFGTKTLLLIDEAQRIQNIGITLKLIADNFPSVQVIATGSSSFDLSNNISEPLTGRKIEFHLYPLSVAELSSTYTQQEVKRLLESFMRFGMYPEVVSSNDPSELLFEISNSYLFKDILEYQTVKNPDLLRQLLQALALR